MKTTDRPPLRIRLFYHSIVSDWNNGHAHFLRGFVGELIARGHDVVVFEREDAWSVENLARECGREPIARFHALFPNIRVERYRRLELEEALADADLVIAHEWTSPELIAALGAFRAKNERVRLLFHDTHHRAVSEPEAMARYDLRHYDGVLAFGDVLSRIYLAKGWAARVWTWHEAADTRIFFPRENVTKDLDLVWIGNWGDGERSAELSEFLIEPVRRLGLRAAVFGVRYPAAALEALQRAGIAYGGWLPNVDAPGLFARARVTVHVPRRPYARLLPGIPTIRPFEAMACGLPLVSGPWRDEEHLFEPGEDYLVAADGAEMEAHLRSVLADAEQAETLAERGLRAIRARHSCAHRVDELLLICDELAVGAAAAIS